MSAKTELTYPQHYTETARSAPGMKQKLKLVHIEAEGSFLTLVYEWKENLSYREADNLDSRARAFIACAIYDAARGAGMSCKAGPPHGKRPSWMVGNSNMPISLVGAGFDVEKQICFMQVGPPVILTRGGGQVDMFKLSQGFLTKFGEIFV